MIDTKIFVVLFLIILVILYNTYQNLGMSRLNKSNLNKVYRNAFIDKKISLIVLFVIIILSSIIFIELNNIKMKPDKDEKSNVVYSFSSTKELY